MQATVETAMDTDGSGQESQRHSPRLAKYLAGKKCHRKYSQTFARRQSVDWEPTKRRFSVETTGQLQDKNKSLVNRIEFGQQQQQQSLSYRSVAEFRTATGHVHVNSGLDQNRKAITNQRAGLTPQQLRLQIKTVSKKSSAGKNKTNVEQITRCTSEADLEDVKSETSVESEAGSGLNDDEHPCRASAAIDGKVESASMHTQRADQARCSGSGNNTTAKPARPPLHEQKSRRPSNASFQCEPDMPSRVVGSGCSWSNESSNKSRQAGMNPSRDLGRGNTGHYRRPDLVTCCSSSPATRTTSLNMIMSRAELQAAAGQCSSANSDALTVNVSEKLQSQDRQRKHVILSMALKQLIAAEPDVSTAATRSTPSGESDDDDDDEEEKQGCRSAGWLTLKDSQESAATEATTKSPTSSDGTATTGRGRRRSSLKVMDNSVVLGNEPKDVSTTRLKINEKLAEISLLLRNSASSDDQAAATMAAINFIKLIQQNQDGLRVVNESLQAARLNVANKACNFNLDDIYQPTSKDIMQEQNKRQTNNNLMRHLVTSKRATADLTGQSCCYSTTPELVGEDADRPRSTMVLLDSQLDKLDTKRNSIHANHEHHKAPIASAATSAASSRRSYSALGRAHINCDSLIQSASNQCDTNLESLIVESWLDDHPAFVHDYFIRKAPRQLIEDCLNANVRVSSTNLRESQFDLCSIGSISRPGSQLSLNGSNGRKPAWMGLANLATANQDQDTANYGCNSGFIRENRSNSQSAASTLARSHGLNTPIRKVSATDFETRSGSGFLRPMLSKTPDGRFSFLPHSGDLVSASQHQHELSSSATSRRIDANQSSPLARSSSAHVSSSSCSSQCSSIKLDSGGDLLVDDTELTPTGSDCSNTSTIEPNERKLSSNNNVNININPNMNMNINMNPNNNDSNRDDDLVGRGPSRTGLDEHEIDDDEEQDEGEVRMIFELVKNIYDDLDIRTLLHKILKNIAALINADRSSLFLVCGGPNDPNRRLVSQLFNVDQDSTELGEADEPITIAWGTGVVGYVAESGEAVNITDCYKDSRFTDAIDQRTGYVTRHMLCAPILDKRNEIVGVAQVINKRDGNAFSKSDEIKFKRYLQFCGIGLRNAQSYEQCQLENRRNQVLLDLARMVFEEQSTIEQVVNRIMLHTQSLLDCERCQVLLIGSHSDELEGLAQIANERSLINCQSSNGGNNNNNNNNNEDMTAAADSRHPDWRPQCRLKDDTGGGQTPRLVSSSDEDVTDTGQLCKQQQQQQQPQHQLQSQQLQAPRLFSLVFDLECDGNGDPVVYDSRASGAMTQSSQTKTSPTTTVAGATNVAGQRWGERPFPINIGITGYVASTGETLNIENAHEHERFDRSVDVGSDFTHRSILCMPIRNGQRQIIGVIQLINKKNGLPFNKNDEDLFEAFAIFCGLGIHNTLMYEQVLKVMAKQRVTFEVLSYHATAPLEEAKKLSQEQIPSCFALNLSSLKFNDFSLDDQYMLKSCLRFFLDLDLIRRFQIDQLVFCNWILSVQKNYRKVTYHPIVGGNGLKASPVRYHNWRHAFNVGQMMFAILVNTKICHSLGELETLALLIACLCHDLDHRGTNNSFQIKSASPLAELYSTSTMEHHHFDQCVMILNSQGNQILSNLSPQEYSRVIMLLEEAILATDLANYFGKRDHFFQLINSDRLDWRNDPAHRSLLRCMLMTACDIAAITKPWSVQKVVADLVMSEFHHQGDIERNELKIEPIDMMNREKQDELPKMQIGFIDSICAPIYTAFAKLFPKQLYTLIDGCLTNRNIWCQLAESNTKPDTTVTNYLACDTEGPSDKLLPNNSNMSKSETRLPSQMLEASDENLQMPATEDADDQADSNSATKQNRFASTTKLPALSSIENKLAETGVSLVQVAKERHNGQRKSI